MFEGFGKTLIILGTIIIFFGIILIFYDKISNLHNIPGDIVIRRKNLIFYFPITTSIILSILITIILNIFRRR